MAEATKTVEMSVPQEALWRAITDYERYPEFVDGMKSVQILSRTGEKSRVQYHIELLGKTISYTLDHLESAPSRMSWTLIESNVLKSNDGGWEIQPSVGGSISVTYRLALEFKVFVPGMILSGLVKNMLPRMLEGFEKQAGKNG